MPQGRDDSLKAPNVVVAGLVRPSTSLVAPELSGGVIASASEAIQYCKSKLRCFGAYAPRNDARLRAWCVCCQLELPAAAEQLVESPLAGAAEIDDAAAGRGIARGPFQFGKAAHQRRTERAGEMVPPLAPVETRLA